MTEKKVVTRIGAIGLGLVCTLLCMILMVAVAHSINVINTDLQSTYDGNVSSYSYTALENDPLVGKASNWSRIYGGEKTDYATSMVATSDGGYAMTGTMLVKTDALGNMEWNKTIGGESLVVTSDGGYAIMGSYNGDALLVKTDANGVKKWNMTYGGTGYDAAYALVATSDGGYAIAGYWNFTYQWASDWSSADSWLVKTDAAGNMEWNRTYGGTDYDAAYALVATSDGGYATAGQTRSFGPSNAWLVKTDSSGNMQWNKTYGGTVKNFAESLVMTSDGGYALAGRWNLDDFDDVLVVKTDSIGNMQWNITYKGPGGEGNLECSLVATSDGGYAIAHGNLLVKTDADGNMEWNRTYGGGNAYALVAAPDGGYTLAGKIWSYEGISTGSQDLWILKTTETGETSSVPEYSSWLIPTLVLTTTAFILISKKRRLRTC